MKIKRFFLFATAVTIAALILSFAACADILNPEINGRWNPADPNYDPTPTRIRRTSSPW
jgi:hypothetical protein